MSMAASKRVTQDRGERHQSVTDKSRRSMSQYHPRVTGTKTRGSTSGRGGRHVEPQMEVVKVLDENGVDVTPKPLLSSRSPIMVPRGTLATGTSTPTSEASESMDARISSASFSIHISGPGGAGPDRSEAASPDLKEAAEEEAAEEAAAEAAKAQREKEKAAIRATVVKEEPPVKPADYEKDVVVVLRETETFFLLDLPARCVHAEAPDAAAVKAKNEVYKKLLQRRAEGEQGSENATQTITSMLKMREASTIDEPPVEMGCQTTESTIWDTAQDANKGRVSGEMTGTAPTAAVGGHDVSAEALASSVTVGTNQVKMQVPGGGAAAAKDKRVSSAMSVSGEPRASEVPGRASMFSQGSARDGDMGELDASGQVRLNEGGGAEALASTGAIEETQVPISQFKNMHHALSMMERAVLQNQFHDQLLMYRGFRLARPDLLPQSRRALVHLWDFSCDAVGGRNVSAIAMNSVREDLIATAYGEYAFLRQGPGMVAFWSLKNPQHPLWTFETPSGVTSLDFSETQPNLLAVGRYDGTVTIYDVASRKVTPMMESTLAQGQHSDPVWNLKWVRRGTEGLEILVSVSTDGRVVQWSIAKGLEHIELMNLKQSSNGAAAPKKEAIVSRRAPGMCFDFSPRDPAVYLVGTEDGGVHRCSVSDSEQYLNSYHGHGGPVYSVQWAPFADSLFLSASADGTTRLWREDSADPIFSFQSEDSQGEVSHAVWSKTNGTVFGAVTTDGRLEIWDIAESVLKPSLTHIMDGYRLSCIQFAEKSPVVMVGNDSGTVSIFRLVGVENQEENLKDQPFKLREALNMSGV